MKDNIITISMLLGILGVLQICNILFGTVIGTKNDKFNFKKFIEGIVKAILFCLAFLGFCFCTEMLPSILTRIDIEIPDSLITLMEIVGVTLTAYKKYASDCYEKIKKILNVKDGDNNGY